MVESDDRELVEEERAKVVNAAADPLPIVGVLVAIAAVGVIFCDHTVPECERRSHVVVSAAAKAVAAVGVIATLATDGQVLCNRAVRHVRRCFKKIGNSP